MGYIDATEKETTAAQNSFVIRINYKTLVLMRKIFPAMKNESAASYFYRLAGEIMRLKNLERGK